MVITIMRVLRRKGVVPWLNGSLGSGMM